MSPVLERLREVRLYDGPGWRRAPRPFPIDKKGLRQLEQMGVRLARFQQAAELLYRRSVKGTAPAWVAQWLDRGKPPELVRLSRERAQAGRVPSLLRPDLLLTGNGFRLTEIDTVPGGSGVAAWMNECYAGEGHAVAGLADATGRLRSRFAGYDVVVSEEASAYRPELEWLYGKGNVHTARGYRFNGRPVYRFFEGFDWMSEEFAEMRASWSPEVRTDPPLKPFLEEKMWLALFWMRPLAGYWEQELGSGYCRDLRQLIPFTWVVLPEEMPPTGELPRLGVQRWEEVGEFSQRERQLVLKRSGFSADAWGARSVVLGADVSGDEWRAAVRRALEDAGRSPWVVQEYHKPAVVEHAVWDEATGGAMPFSGRARLCPYFLADDGRAELLAVHVTLCPPDKKVIHGMADAVICPGGAGI